MTRKIRTNHGPYALVDDNDYKKVVPYAWYLSVNGPLRYAVTTICGRTLSMHRMLMNPSPAQQVDHKNHNGLDNRRKNLRCCTQSQNQGNRVPRGHKTSYFRGITFDSRSELWRARIQINGRVLHLGRFDTELEAAVAWNRAAKKAWGVFAFQNKVRKVRLNGRR